MNRLIRYIKYFDYYLEILAKYMSGRGLMNPNRNGEYLVLKNIVKNHDTNQTFTFIDGGSNIGEHISYFDKICKGIDRLENRIVAIEPFPDTIKILKKNLANLKYELVEAAVGDKNDEIIFYTQSSSKTSGQNSAIQHYYLDRNITVKQTTIDEIISTKRITNVNFLKLDIEGMEYKALIGASQSLEAGIIDYIQLEYNQTWIEGGGSIFKIMQICKQYDYELFRIKRNQLLSIPNYNFNLEDFFYSNLLLIRRGCDLPLPSKRKVNPIV